MTATASTPTSDRELPYPRRMPRSAPRALIFRILAARILLAATSVVGAAACNGGMSSPPARKR